MSARGTTLVSLMDMAQAIGLTGRPLRLDIEELKQLQTPCILHWDLNHYVVLRSVNRKGAVIHDPAHGLRTLAWKDVDRSFTGVALELSVGPTLTRKPKQPPVSIRSLTGPVGGLWRALGTVLALSVALELLALLAPQFLQLVVDQVIADGDKDLLKIIGIGFAVLLVIEVVISSARSWTLLWLGTHFSLNWTANVFQHLMKLPQEYFLKRHLGDVVSRFAGIDAIQHTMTSQFIGAILDGLMVALTLGLMIAYSPVLTTFSVVAISIYLLIRATYFRVYREANLSQIVVSAKQQTKLIESIRGVQTLRMFNQVSSQTARYANAVSDTLNTTVAIQRLNLIFGALSSMTTGVQRIGGLWLGAWLALNGKFSAGMLMAFTAYADQFMSRASGLVDYSIQVRMLRLQAERLSDIVLTAPEPHLEGDYVGEAPLSTITFKSVSFRYSDNDPWILKDCNFEIAAKETVAIIGPSGCGKSTLVRLMLGLLDPVEGTIAVGGVDLRRLGKRAYRELVASVLQDDRMFSGTVADNISFFDGGAVMPKVKWAAKLAQLHDDISRMPMGYNSLTGDMGRGLSGGQQQRILLARAFYRRPSILVLDEATSHLDVEREDIIMKGIGELEVTRIIIAHRPETIAHADRVYLFNEGVLTECT